MSANNVLPLDRQPEPNADVNDEQNTEDSAKRKRAGGGVIPPIMAFSESCRVGGEIAMSRRVGTREQLALALNSTPSSSVFAKKVSALGRHGLFKFKDLKYAATSLLIKITRPTSHEEEISARFAAFLEDKMIRAVWENYKGGMLQDPPFVQHFIEGLGAPTGTLQRWYTYFVEGGIFAGILHPTAQGRYMVLSEPNIPTSSQSEPGAEDAAVGPAEKLEGVAKQGEGKDAQPSAAATGNGSSDKQGLFTVTDLLDSIQEISHGGVMMVPEISNERKAIFVIPGKLTYEDAVALTSILDGLKQMVRGLLKPGEKKLEPISNG